MNFFCGENVLREVIKKRAQGVDMASREEEQQEESPDESSTSLMKAALARWTVWRTSKF